MMQQRKLIEAALPLDAINAAAAREKSIRHGHPASLHLWWSRKPLAACRAVLFASLVDDPSCDASLNPDEQNARRADLFELITRLVDWRSSNDPAVLSEVRAVIRESCGGELPAVLDPFAGGGSIPLEAQRLGLEAHAGDLNPVAVLINKALIEIPSRFAGKPAVHPDQPGVSALGSWPGSTGLAADVRHYGRWMRDRAADRIGHLYPDVELPAEHGGERATAIAWLWTRAVRCANPACGVIMPLASSWWLSKKKSRRSWLTPVIDGGRVRFRIDGGVGEPPSPPKHGRAKFRCIVCGEACPEGHVKSEAAAGRMGALMTAVAAEGNRQRVYLAPDERHEQAARIDDCDAPDFGGLPEKALGFRVQQWGMTQWADLFTPRQMTALCTFSDLVSEVREQIQEDARAAGMAEDGVVLRDGGTGASAYAAAVSVYLAFAVSKLADLGNSLCAWEPNAECPRHLFARQAIPMIWDFAEGNPLSESSGSWSVILDGIVRAFDSPAWPPPPPVRAGRVERQDATLLAAPATPVLVSTDPPYYDNVGYADVSDFFYVWLRRSLRSVFPETCSTLLAPKSQELIAAPYRHDDDRRTAEGFFEDGLGRVFERLRDIQDPRFPLTVYYAFKQAETDEGGTASTGWETMLAALLDAGLSITGTWPVRSEASNRMRSLDSNALASSIVLVCRPRPADAPVTSRRDFLDRLSHRLPEALTLMRQGSIAPVDLAQAAIGPGMEIFSQYSRVVEASGTDMTVRDALAAINRVLDETLEGTDADLDADTRWAVTWYSEQGHDPGDYGRAEQLSKARNTSVAGLVEAGIAEARGGKVRLLPRAALDRGWDPEDDQRRTVWEVAQHMIRRLEDSGERAAADLLRSVGADAEPARDLAYRLYHICERKGWAAEALAYNGLVAVWPELTRLAAEPAQGQTDLGFTG